MDIVKMIQSVADAGSAALKEAQQHEQLKNSPAMIKAHVVQAMQTEFDNHAKAISNEDLEAYRIAVAATPQQPS